MINIVMNFVPFWLEQMEFLILVYNSELEYPLFHLGSKSGQFRGISVIPMCFGKYRPKLKIRPVCVLGLLHTSQFTKIEEKEGKKKKKKKDKIHIRSKKKKKKIQKKKKDKIHIRSKKKKKKIQVMDKAQVLPLKLTSLSLCLCHFQREKEGV